MAAQQERKFKVIGTRPIRHDGADKVTGRAQYGADIDLAGLLHGKTLRSPHAHANIKSIDTSAAEALPKHIGNERHAVFPGDAVEHEHQGESEPENEEH